MLTANVPTQAQRLSLGLGRWKGRLDAGEGQRLCSVTLNRLWWYPLTASVLFGGWKRLGTGEGQEENAGERPQLQS